MTTLYAQPYDISANGFYFETAAQYYERATQVKNDCGQPVEEFEIQFIDGEKTDCALASAWGIHQGNFATYLEAVATWDTHRKQRYIIAVGECGYTHDQFSDDAEIIDIYQIDSLKELATAYVDEGLYGDIPSAIAPYIDYDAIARDLGMELTEIEIAGERLIYGCR